jgi:hypothetical protein
MAIFASTTTSGYSDPLKAMSIKALEKRLADQQAQMAQQQPDTALMGTIPGGIGHVLGKIGDRMEQGRNEQAIAAQKAELARAMSGYDPTGDAPPPAGIATLAPDMYKDMMQTWAAARQQRAGFTHADAAQGRLFGHQDATAAKANENTELGRQATAEEARATAERKVEADKLAAVETHKVQREAQNPEFVKMSKALEEGKIDQVTFDAWKKKQLAPPVNEQEFILKTQKESVENQSALGTLDQALGFIDHPDSIFAGKNADISTSASSRLPEKLTGLSEKTRENTSSYNKIMGGQALQLLTNMKGASSDKDVKINFDIANDPNATADEKKRAILVLKEKLAYYVKLNNAAVEGAGGAAPKLGGGGGASADPLEGRTANGPDGPIVRRGGKWVKQ